MDLARILNICFCVVQSGALSRSIGTRIFGLYPWFTASLLGNIAELLLLTAFTWNSPEYFAAYIRIALLTLALRIAATFEAWAISSRQYPNIGKSAHVFAWSALTAGIFAAFLLGLPGIDLLSLRHVGQLQRWEVFGTKYASTALAVLCGLGWALNSWIDDGVRPNARRHIAILTGYWGVQSIGFLSISNYRSHSALAGMLATASASAFIGLWGYSMRQDGEIPVRLNLRGDTSVLDHLETIRRRVLSL